MRYDVKAWKATPDWAAGTVIKELCVGEQRLVEKEQNEDTRDALREAFRAARAVLRETSRCET